MRQNQWAMRMMHEKGYWKDSCFITLTYNNENLPKDGYLDKPELQRFIKRLRKNIGDRKIKYFACGEYGEKFGRPHYHLIVFGVSVMERDVIEKSWKLGFIKVEGVTRRTCRYVAKYVTKALLGRSRSEFKRLGGKAEFQTCSRGIGLSWIMENAESIGDTGIHYHGKIQTMPRYYVNKGWKGGLRPQFIEDIRAERMQDNFKRTLALINKGLSSEAIAKYHEAQKLQRIEEIKSQDQMYKAKDDL